MRGSPFRSSSCLAALIAFGSLSLGCGKQGAVPQLPDSPAAEIPIKRVVLYQNGVGYFEREGLVDGNQLTLQIRPSQINDILKSLTVVDAADGRAVSVSLPLEKSGDRVLTELPEQVRNANGLLQILSVFRGARVELETRSGGVAGRIVGVESMEQRVGDHVATIWRATVRTDEGEIAVVAVDDISKVLILDRTLAVGLEQSLDVSLNEGEWKPTTLAIRLAGNPEHRLRASYIVEMPRWKPAYRIVMANPKPLLQGWAVVDNVSGEQWKDVHLSLVAGAPLSFIYDLHSSQYTQRVDMSPQGRQVAMAPPVEEGGTAEYAKSEAAPAAPEPEASMDYDDESAAMGAGAGMGSASRDMMVGGALKKASAPRRPAPAPAPPVALEAPAAQVDQLLESQSGPSVNGAQVGSLFRYDIADPVTVPDRSSTLVAIVNKRVSADEVVLFRPDYEGGPLGQTPYRAIKFTNDTPYTLEKGPVTLYTGSTFLGEGFLDRVEPGATHFVSYALDGKVSLNSDYSTKEEGGRLLSIVDGQILSEVLVEERTTYTIKNLNKEAVTAYVKGERRSDWKLSNQPQGTVETPNALIVPVSVPAGKSADLPIIWTKTMERNIEIGTDIGTTVLKLYLQGGHVPPEIAKTLKEVLDTKSLLQQNQTDSARVRGQYDDSSRDQARVRDNLDTLRKTKGNQALQAQLAQKLAKQEEELGKLSGKLVELSEAGAALERRLTVLIKNVRLSKAE
ncbi:MAG TPA: hypothetical protein VHM70_26815 [Polyangiaceae bacterium]|nr:hypothetical protein [Polyangiaceae bacterium]